MNLVEWSEGLLPEGVDLAAPLPTASIPLRTSAEDARGYREVDVLYTCIPDAVYPWDPKAVKAIQRFMPDAVPMWVHWVFLRPNSKEKVVFGRHALGRAIKEPGRDLLPFRCSMPSMPCQGLTFEKPNRIWFIHEGDRVRDYPDIPGTFLPFDSSIVDRAWESCRYMKMSDKEYKEAMEKEFIEAVVEEISQRKARRNDDMAQRDNDWHSYADPLMQAISDVERREYLQSRGRRGRSKKAMVFHGARTTRAQGE